LQLDSYPALTRSETGCGAYFVQRVHYSNITILNNDNTKATWFLNAL